MYTNTTANGIIVLPSEYSVYEILHPCFCWVCLMALFVTSTWAFVPDCLRKSEWHRYDAMRLWSFICTLVFGWFCLLASVITKTWCSSFLCSFVLVFINNNYVMWRTRDAMRFITNYKTKNLKHMPVDFIFSAWSYSKILLWNLHFEAHGVYGDVVRISRRARYRMGVNGIHVLRQLQIRFIFLSPSLRPRGLVVSCDAVYVVQHLLNKGPGAWFRRVVTWTSFNLSNISPFSQIRNKVQKFSLKKIHLKLSSAKCRTFYSSLNALIPIGGRDYAVFFLMGN